MDFVFVLGRSIVCGPSLLITIFLKTKYEIKAERLLDNKNIEFTSYEGDHFNEMEYDFMSNRFRRSMNNKKLNKGVHFELFRLQPIRYMYNHQSFYLPLYALTSLCCGIFLYRKNPQLYLFAQICQISYLVGRHS